MLQRTPKEAWPPDYGRIKRERAARLRILLQDLSAQRGAKLAYARGVEGCIAFIEDWCETFDPRNAGTGRPTTMPFILFKRQREFIEFLYACYEADADGLVEKCRDVGATWLCASFSVWLFLFVPGSTIGWGSRDGAQVDKIGDLSSIFEKMRFQLRSVPRIFWPDGFGEENMNLMRIYASKCSITGECGDDIGRGGRTRVTFKDESAHYVHPELIEAALGDNTRVQIDISSVNGLGNVFHRKREAGVEWTPGAPVQRGKTNVFVFDWSDHPEKTQEWHDQREAKAIEDGLLHVFAQEVDRNYSASVEGVIIPAAWVKSAIDAHIRLGFEEHENDDNYAGLDVADGGGDRNALARRKGVILRYVEEWGARDTGVTARRAVDSVSGLRRVSVQYDCIGVGAGVKSEVNRLNEDEDTKAKMKGIEFVSWDAGAKVQDPDKHVVINDDGTEDHESPLNKDFYSNLSAQAGWQLRRRFEKTHRAIRKLEGDPEEAKFTWQQDELISLDSTLPLLRTLEKELSQPTVGKDTRLRLKINKKPDGTKSPNLFDAVKMCYWPVQNSLYDASMEWVQ